MVVGVGGQLFLVALQAEYYQWETGTEEPAVGRIEAVHWYHGGGKSVGKVDTADGGTVVVGHEGEGVGAY